MDAKVYKGLILIELGVVRRATPSDPEGLVQGQKPRLDDFK